MHEVFLDAIIEEEDLDRTARVLQGYCNMAPVCFLRRRLYWEGPKLRNPKGLNMQHETLKSSPPPKLLTWKSLNEHLRRQSYVITLAYDLDHEKHLGKINTDQEGPDLDCDTLPGTLRWNDIPEPGINKVAHSRLFVSVEKETKLCEVLKTSNYRFTRELIEEVQRFVHDHVMFELYRPLQLPVTGLDSAPNVQRNLPSFDKLRLFDAENKWILRATAVILDGTDQSQMNEGVKLLAEVKSDFEGFINFDLRDRFLHDTRVKA